MSAPKGFKRLVLFRESPDCPALLGSSIVQDPTAKPICSTCPTRLAGFEVKGTLVVLAGTKADKDSPELHRESGTPACFHMGQRAIILAGVAPELAEKFADEAEDRLPEPPIFRTGDGFVESYFNT